MTLSSAGPLAPGDFISKGFLVSMAGCLGEWGCGGGLALDSCGVGLSVVLTGGRGAGAALASVLVPSPQSQTQVLWAGRESGDLVLVFLPPASHL